MEPRLILGIIIIAAGFIFFGAFLYFFLFRPNETGGMTLGASSNFRTPSTSRDFLKEDPTGGKYNLLKKVQRKQFKKKRAKASDTNLYLQAGMYREDEVRRHEALRYILPCVFGPIFAFATFSVTETMNFALLVGALGVACGIQAPTTILNRKVKKRSDEIMYFLPLVIEQVAIGVSSSLDVGPCLQRVVAMADERDKHNVVTELVRRSMFLVRSGSSLEEALSEVGTNSGHNELKHSFIAMSQVSKHGGEISKQLMQLADAVNVQRETKVEAKIKKLELEATGPVAMVFFGFIIIILVGFGIQIKNGLM